MSLIAISFIVETVLLVVAALMVVSLWKDMKKAEDDLEKSRLELISKKNELEVIQNAQTKLKESRGKKAPQKTEAPASGDSGSRIARLNGVQDGSSK